MDILTFLFKKLIKKIDILRKVSSNCTKNIYVYLKSE